MATQYNSLEYLADLRTQYNLLRLEVADKVMQLTELKTKIRQLEEKINIPSDCNQIKKEFVI